MEPIALAMSWQLDIPIEQNWHCLEKGCYSSVQFDAVFEKGIWVTKQMTTMWCYPQLEPMKR